ncbi:hypothetical protein [Mesorhizobium sp. M4B.F.Ca.ET.017.02.2.1]|uniref:hypothetical protein n=1 Tax=Mesorhizobium sp. M4B.F.Ca.ET.017.02.2.1 TaxID=2496649 RepID=UPI000FCA0538|nr:hypothetical protein [Mesorhizobium sp. M4B.F.Ca.ET.017.02.2.1]RVD27585.1 hypothetical protein EN738_11645 [Mesorhizobium sp. M4B.F.Ca.ET.017.02.2.1]
MSNPRLQDIQTAVRLLTDLSRSTFQGRYADCEAIIAQHLKDGSAFLLELIKAAVEAGVHQVTLIEDAVSFLDDADLARLAFFLQSAASRGTDVEDLLSHALLQAPDLFPDAALATSYDFADWQQHPICGQPQRANILSSKGVLRATRPFRRTATTPLGICRPPADHLRLAAEVRRHVQSAGRN